MFNQKQRALLESVSDRKWRMIDGDLIRVMGTRNNGLVENICPVCAAAIKIKPIPNSLNYREAMVRVPLDLTPEDAAEIVYAADSIYDRNHAELCQILNVR